MKKCSTALVIALLFLLQVDSLSGQNLLVPVFFEDAAGNRDTLLAGWHPSATDSLDPSLNELNILSVPIDPVFDVRFSDEFFAREQGQPTGSYHSKRQYIGQPCTPGGVPAIDIYCHHWPLRVSWDPVPMQAGCTVNAVYTDVHPGGWFDTGGLFISCMIGDSVIELRQPDFSMDPVQYWYNPASQDTVYTTFMLIGNADVLSIGFMGCGMVARDEALDMDGIRCYPQPADKVLNLDLPSAGYEWQLNDLSGRLLAQGRFAEQNVRLDLPASRVPGLHFLRLVSPAGNSTMHKVWVR